MHSLSKAAELMTDNDDDIQDWQNQVTISSKLIINQIYSKLGFGLIQFGTKCCNVISQMSHSQIMKIRQYTFHNRNIFRH